jgi:hypothetical protein
MSIETPTKTGHRKRVSFTPDEDDRLRALVAKFGDNDWGRVASKLPRRDRRQCRERWFKYLTPHVRNGPWSREEEELLRHRVHELGHRWTAIRASFPGRTAINVNNHWKQMKKLDVGRDCRPPPGEERKGPVKDVMDSLILNGDCPDQSANSGLPW